MLNSKKIFTKLFPCLICTMAGFGYFVPKSFAAELSGTVSVNQTSDTAANAKIKAIDTAQRQILFDVLSNYSNRDVLSEVLKNTPNEELLNLISSSSVANEKIASDTYSATVTMVLDNDAIKKWMDEKNIQNWVPATNSSEKFTVSIILSNPITDWAQLKQIARSENVEIETQTMTANKIIASMPLNYRTKFTAAVRSLGWKYADNNGTLQIWK